VPQRHSRSDGAIEGTAMYHIQVVACDVGDAVRFAGGWICDRVAAGFRVAILTNGIADTRAARIVGATVIDLNAITAEGAGTLNLVSEPRTGEEQMRRHVRAVATRNSTGVTVWGGLYADISRRGEVVHHRLSSAAYLFKGHALAATGFDGPVDVVETFHARRHCRTPAGGAFFEP